MLHSLTAGTVDVVDGPLSPRTVHQERVQGVIYNVNFSDCQAVYIGEAKNLNNRFRAKRLQQLLHSGSGVGHPSYKKKKEKKVEKESSVSAKYRHRLRICCSIGEGVREWAVWRDRCVPVCVHARILRGKAAK